MAKPKSVKGKSPKTAKAKPVKSAPKSKPKKPVRKPAKPAPKKPVKKPAKTGQPKNRPPVKRLPPVVSTPGRDALTKQLLDAADMMQDVAPGVLSEVHSAPGSRSFTPWKMIVRFVMPNGTSYEDVYDILVTWERDRKIERAIGRDRLSRIQIRYLDNKGRGAHGEYTISEIGPWEIVISRAVETVGVRDGRAVALRERYGSESDSPSYIDSLIVWFSSMTSKEIKLGRGQS